MISTATWRVDRHVTCGPSRDVSTVTWRVDRHGPSCDVSTVAWRVDRRVDRRVTCWPSCDVLTVTWRVDRHVTCWPSRDVFTVTWRVHRHVTCSPSCDMFWLGKYFYYSRWHVAITTGRLVRKLSFTFSVDFLRTVMQKTCLLPLQNNWTRPQTVVTQWQCSIPTTV